MEWNSSFLRRGGSRRNRVIAMDISHEQELEHFQKHVEEQFAALDRTENGAPFLSIAWLRDLLYVFLSCEAEFKALMIGRDPMQLVKPPVCRLMVEFFDRAVKGLDIFNTVYRGLDAVQQHQKLAEMMVSALDRRPVCDAQVRRARKAAASLLRALKSDDICLKPTERTWSFSRRGGNREREPGSFKSVSTIISRNSSASKQIHAMCSNLLVPREADGLALPIYVMSVVMVMVMWVLLVAVPCKESALSLHYQIPKNLDWAQSLIALQDRVGMELKKKERRGLFGAMEELQELEEFAQRWKELVDGSDHSPEAEKTEELAALQMVKMSEMCRRMDDGLVHLQQQTREAFHRMVSSRTAILELMNIQDKIS